MYRRCLFAIGLFALFFALASPEAHAKTVEATWGPKAAGSLGGQFSEPRDVAVEEASGDVYIADASNNRVQRLSSSGEFELAWGWDVVQPGGVGNVAANKRQRIEVTASSGTFQLTFRRGATNEATTGPISVFAGATTVQSALEALPNAEPGEIAVSGPTGGPWEVEFTGALSDSDLPAIQARSIDLGGDPVALRVRTIAHGGSFEVCTIASQCKAGTSNGLGGSLNLPARIVFNQASGHVFVREEARISAFDPSVADPADFFLRAFGWNTIVPGGTGNVPGNERQVLRMTRTPEGGTFRLQWAPPGFAGSSPLVGQPGYNDKFATSSLPYDATGAQIEAALLGLPVLAPGDVFVSGPAGGPWSVEFAGAYADTNVDEPEGTAPGGTFPDLLPKHDSDTGVSFSYALASTTRDGGSYEVCTVAVECQAAVEGEPSSAAEAGQLDHAEAIGFVGGFAIDPADGDLYAASLRRINHYRADGSFVRAFGWGVDTGEERFEVCTAASGCGPAVPPKGLDGGGSVFQANGQFKDDPSALAIDTEGTLYAGGLSRQSSFSHPGVDEALITRFDVDAVLADDILLPDPIASSDPSDACTYCTPGPLPPAEMPIDFEVAADSGHLLYLTREGILEIDTSTHPATVADTHIPGADVSFGGLGIDNARSKLYASAANDPGLGHRIIVIGDTPATPATVAIDPVSAIGAEAATFSGSVTPNGPPGIETTYRFEYSLQGTGQWKAVPVPDGELGDGTSPIAVSRTVTDLDPNATYLVRLVASKGLGLGSIASPVLEFTTAQLPPTAKTVVPQARTATTADLTGIVDANNLPTSYRFEYGETSAYGTSVPVPDGVVNGPRPQRLVERIEGLEPATTYHFRIVAVSSEGTAVGDDVAFTTRGVSEAPAGRAYEMVTPPFKVVRAPVAHGSAEGNNPNPGVPSLDGETIVWNVPFFPLSDEVDWPDEGDKRIIRRTSTGWVHETMNTLSVLSGRAVLQSQDVRASSGDMETVVWDTAGGVTDWAQGGLLPTEGPAANRYYTRRFGTGTEGFTPWLTNPSAQVQGLGVDVGLYDDYQDIGDRAVLNDDGSAMARWGLYGGLAEDPATPQDDDPSDNGLSVSIPLLGRMVYLQRAAAADQMPAAPKELVNACTTTAGVTRIPRIVSGAISAGTCPPARAITSPRGAVVGGGNLGPGAGPGAGSAGTALSEDGSRVFFASPDPESAPTSCSGNNSTTSCPPQLFVRQYNAEGEPVVRWISHSRSVADGEGGFTGTAAAGQLIAGQEPAQMGEGVAFQGASRGGEVVYFQTNAPLVPTDPNGGASIAAGAANPSSWDLYRYELPQSLEADPDDGTLTRISGGPDGSADPNVSGSGGDGSARFVSDDGSRVYFLTKTPIAGADTTAPSGGATVPDGGPADEVARNLYLYDAEAPSTDRYRFLGRLSAGAGLAACATGGSTGGLGALSAGPADTIEVLSANCFHGTPDGSHIVFMTTSQLSGDDVDEASDVYLYDADADDLTRLSAPPADASPYVCARGKARGPGEGDCNADFGHSPPTFHASAVGSADAVRGWGGLRYYNVAENPDGTVSVFFQSRSELVPEDVNGAHWDVFEWRAGELRLLSRGRPGHHSYYSGNSTDGEDVFIWTSDRIDPRELDDSGYDLYDVRRGGGFPLPTPEEPCDVLAHRCRGDAVPAPAAPSPVAPRGEGNVKSKGAPKRCGKNRVRRKGRCVKKKKKRGAKRAGARRGGRR
jgi:hypothetical protein